MGKGDKRSKRGKINSGSYGNSRPRKSATVVTAPVAKEEKPARTTRKKKES